MIETREIVDYQVSPGAYKHWRVSYADRVATVIMDVAEDGRIARTELQVEVDNQTTAGIRVSFDVDSKLGMAVPVMMEEDYAVGAPVDTVISCKAVYTNFRRFETSVRIVP